MAYAEIWERALQPAYERLRGRETSRLAAQLARSQWLPPEQTARRAQRDLAALLVHARDQVDFYADWFGQSGLDPCELAAEGDLSQLPLVDKKMFMDHPERFRYRSMPKGGFSKSTGGSTGRPLTFWVSPLSDQWRQAVTRRGYAWAGCAPGVKQVHFWGSDITPPPLSARLKRGLHRALLRQRFVDCFRLAPADLDHALDMLDRFRPRCLVAYTSAAEALARRALETKRRPPPSLASVITGAEALFPAQRELIQQGLGCLVFETYGSREFMLIAAECEERRGLHVSAENLIVEIIKDGRPAAPGQTGEVVITDLHNLAQPFIRYRTGDLAQWARGSCPCGRGLPRLAQVEGRILDLIRSPSGQVLPGEFFPHFLKDFPAVERFQVRQDRPDRLVISLVLRRALEASEEQAVLDQTRRALPGVEPVIRPVEDIPVTAAGKRRVTIGLGDSDS